MLPSCPPLSREPRGALFRPRSGLCDLSHPVLEGLGCDFVVSRVLGSSGPSAQTSVAVWGGVEERMESEPSSPLRVPRLSWHGAATQPIWHARQQQSGPCSLQWWMPCLAHRHSARAQSILPQCPCHLARPSVEL